MDAIILLEGCLSGRLNHAPRRPHDRERAELIVSGSVFIYEEASSGIKRWTDGISWSPSRSLGNYLVYRQLSKPFPPGEKKRALKKGDKSNEDQEASLDLMSQRMNIHKNTLRGLVGSLTGSYDFKDNGLVKKTISFVVGTVSHHVVSYYTIMDGAADHLITPSSDPMFNNMQPRPELYAQNFKCAIDDDSPPHRNSVSSNFGMTNDPLARPSSMALPTRTPAAMNYSLSYYHSGSDFQSGINYQTGGNYQYFTAAAPSANPLQNFAQQSSRPVGSLYNSSNAPQGLGNNPSYSQPYAFTPSPQPNQGYGIPSRSLHGNSNVNQAIATNDSHGHSPFATTHSHGTQPYAPAQGQSTQSYPPVQGQSTQAYTGTQGQAVPRAGEPYPQSANYSSDTTNPQSRDEMAWPATYNNPGASSHGGGAWPANSYPN